MCCGTFFTREKARHNQAPRPSFSANKIYRVFTSLRTQRHREDIKPRSDQRRFQPKARCFPLFRIECPKSGYMKRRRQDKLRSAPLPIIYCIYYNTFLQFCQLFRAEKLKNLICDQSVHDTLMCSSTYTILFKIYKIAVVRNHILICDIFVLFLQIKQNARCIAQSCIFN